MAAPVDVGVLQDEVERILRRLTLEETREVAAHLQNVVDDNATKRDILGGIQETFDGAVDDEARNGLLRGLPIPEDHRDDYQRLMEPPAQDEVGDNHANPRPQVVPGADLVLGQGLAADQIVPDNGGLQANGLQNGPQQNVGNVVQQNLSLDPSGQLTL